MAFVKPAYSKGQINRAGDQLASLEPDFGLEYFDAIEVLANWRGAHAYPINTFQSTLRSRLKAIDPEALVAQRLKRTPSIIAKLRRFEGMELARMQDIGGLRVVVADMSKLRNLVAVYQNSRFSHKQQPAKDYISSPKPDGYRSVHLIYRYSNDRAKEYNGLSVELQIRTKLQHAWATGVETMGTFLGQALKSGQGEVEWMDFFQTSSAAFAIMEKTAPVPGFERNTRMEIYEEIYRLEQRLNVLNKLRGFAIAADRIKTETGAGSYHLIVLNSQDKSVTLRPFATTRLDEANKEYAAIEEQAKKGAPLEAVLVSAGPIDALRKAYPNYFLDTEAFIAHIQRIINAYLKTKREPEPL